jgi:hypothetical protein
MGESGIDQVEKLRRWELSGASWRVVDRAGGRAVVELCTCTGELMETLTSSEAALLAYLDARVAEGGEPPAPSGTDLG